MLSPRTDRPHWRNRYRRLLYCPGIHLDLWTWTDHFYGRHPGSSHLAVGFYSMLLVAFGYRELNNRVPDSGTSFTWSSKAFNPWIGWMGGWGLISATVIVLSNLAA